LAIPVTLQNGEAFPHRNLILFITFVVILLTLVVQGLTLPYLIQRTQLFGLYPQEPEEEARQKLLEGLYKHTYRFLRNKYDNELNDHVGLQRMLKHVEEKMEASDDSWMNEKTKAVFIEMLESQREYLSEINKDPAIDEEIIRQQLFRIDLEEERIKMI